MSQRFDKIMIKDLLIRGILGINPDERENQQDLLLNITLWADIRAAAASDQIEDAVNYRSLTKRVIQHVKGSADFLVEKLVTDLAELILKEFPVERVVLRLEKPGALRFAKTVGIEIDRSRSS